MELADKTFQKLLCTYTQWYRENMLKIIKTSTYIPINRNDEIWNWNYQNEKLSDGLIEKNVEITDETLWEFTD